MNNIYDKDWEYKGIDGAIQNDWYIIPIIITGAIVALIVFVGADRFIEVMSDFIVGIRANP